MYTELSRNKVIKHNRNITEYNIIMKTEINFKPQGLFKSGHFQTVYASLFHKPTKLENTQRIPLKTEENTTIEYELNKAQKNTTNLVILVHGLEGSSNSNYIVSTAKKLVEHNFDVIRINLRNCGNTIHLTRTFYNAGLTHDLKYLLDKIHEDDNYENIFLAGFSLGANLVLKLGGEYGDNFPKKLKGICAVSPPLELEQSSKSMLKLSNKIYDQYYLKRLLKTYRKKGEYFPDVIDLALLKRVKKLFDFDNLITGPHFNYKDALDYYSKNSSINFLEAIKVKTLIIQAKDDPIIPPISTEKAMLIKNAYIQYLFVAHGGHVGFINSKTASKNDLDIYWSENRIVDFVTSNFLV